MTGSARRRYGSIDTLKAAAIVTVVWIHAFGRPLNLDALSLEALGTWWAVPAFFFASGFLHFRATPISVATWIAWARRLLGPYLVASLVVLAARRWLWGEPLGWREGLVALAAGSAFNVYYYVPVLMGALVLAVGLSRRPQLALATFVLFWLSGLLGIMGVEPVNYFFGLFWMMRSPFVWWGYFLAGWVAAQHRETLAGLSAGQRQRVGSVAAGLVAVVAVGCLVPGSWRMLGRPLLYVATYAVIVAVVALGARVGARRAVRFLSEMTYPAYLYHFLFIAAVKHAWGASLGWAMGPVAFACGWAGALAVVRFGRAAFGRHARALFG